MKNRKKRLGSIRERFRYWFDNHMAKSSLGFIRVLIAASLLLAAVIAVLIIVLGFNEEGETASVFWDSIATVLNAWMPSYSDGSIGYVALMSVSAIAGVLFTSVLIGIITSAIEEKIVDLKKGNSPVLESGHTVVLGFDAAQFKLLEQLILAAEDEPCCIVIAEDMDREDMEQSVAENLDVPKNVRIVCRTADTSSPQSIEKCSLETARTVIVNTGDDIKVTKAILAASAVLKEKGAENVRICGIISDRKYRLPESLAAEHSISVLRMPDVLSKMIAHSCTQSGLSETFREIFNFDGSEFHLTSVRGAGNLNFGELSLRLDRGIAAGLCRDGKVILNPQEDFRIAEGDSVLVFSENAGEIRLTENGVPDETVPTAEINKDTPTEAAIIGRGGKLKVILRELPENVTSVTLVGDREITDGERNELNGIAGERGLALEYMSGNPGEPGVMLEVAKKFSHIVLLGDSETPGDEADMETMMLLLNFRDIRDRFGLRFNLTVEMRNESSQILAGAGDNTDFLVNTSMSSLILAQLAENPELTGFFTEILSNTGNEIYLKNAGSAGLCGNHSVAGLRKALLNAGYILLGYVDANRRSAFLQSPGDSVTLCDGDDLIVIGRE